MKYIRHNMTYIFLLFLCKTAFEGFNYYPALDDYIQFISYRFYTDKWNEIIVAGGLFGMRPLAGLADVYIWSYFHENLNLMYFILSIFHFLSFVFFMKAFENLKIKAGIFFTAFYLFLPITVEAVYWLSASTRIIIPLFFCAVGLYFIQKRKFLYPAWFFNLISYCFYEQILIVSFLLTVFAAWKTNKKRLSIPIINALIIGIWYIIFSSYGINSSRSGIAFDVSKILLVFRYLRDIWTVLLPQFFLTGILNIFSFGYIIIIVVFLLCLAILYQYRKEKNYVIGEDLILPLMLLVFPYVPFIFLKDSWPGLRNAMPSIMAIGLLLDLMPEGILKKYLPPILMFFSVFSYYTSVINYKQVFISDQQVLNFIIENDIPKTVTIHQSSNKTYPQYGEYIKNITSSNWALTGALRAKTRNVKIPLIVITNEGGFEIYQ